MNAESTIQEPTWQQDREAAIEKERADSNHTFWIGFLVGLALIVFAWSAMKGWVL